MSLRGRDDGGYIAPIPAGFDDTLDLTLHLKVRRDGTQASFDRLLTVLSAARTRGVIILTGGGAATGGSANDLFAVCGAGTTGSWGSSATHGGRGLGRAGLMSDGTFDSLVVVVRGSAAADNSGTTGAQQIHEVWLNGAFGTVGAASSALGSGVTGSRVSLLMREGSASNYFSGWLADVTVWQGWRPDAAAYARFAAGDDPRTIGPAPLLFRSLRSALAAEIGDTPTTAAGTPPTIDAAVNPVATATIAPAGAKQPHSAQASRLTAMAALKPDASRHPALTSTTGIDAPRSAVPEGAVRHAVATEPRTVAVAIEPRTRVVTTN